MPPSLSTEERCPTCPRLVEHGSASRPRRLLRRMIVDGSRDRDSRNASSARPRVPVVNVCSARGRIACGSLASVLSLSKACYGLPQTPYARCHCVNNRVSFHAGYLAERRCARLQEFILPALQRYESPPASPLAVRT